MLGGGRAPVSTYCNQLAASKAMITPLNMRCCPLQIDETGHACAVPSDTACPAWVQAHVALTDAARHVSQKLSRWAETYGSCISHDVGALDRVFRMSQLSLLSIDFVYFVPPQVLASEISVGYEEIVNTQVVSANGQKISSLREVRLMQLIYDPAA